MPLREGRPPGTAGKSFSTPFQFTPLREGRPWRVRLKRFLWQSFQFTPLREGRRGKSTQDGTPLPFQFTPLREGRRRSCPRRPRPCDFNSRPSARGDTKSFTGCGKTYLFQFTPLREGRPAPRQGKRHAPYFNSRPSARGDRFHRPEEHHLSISIHAPPRGATDIANDWLQETLISIHAPPRGATGCQRPPWRGRQNFNSRPSARGDPDEFAAMIAA